MTQDHDPVSRLLARASDARQLGALSSLATESAARARARPDPLADVLRHVKLSGAVFFFVDASSPWRIDVPPGRAFASAILPRAQHIISYHIVTRGSCWGELCGEAPLPLEAGDILVIPHGDAYAMAIEPDHPSLLDGEAILGFFRGMARGELPFAIEEGGGGQARLGLVCGFLGCDLRPFNPLLATLPRLLRVPRPPDADTDMLGRLIEFTLAESREPRPGSEAIRLRLSELLFVEVLRRHLASLPAGQGGWLAGLRDPIVGRALTLLHERPADAWTLEGLAQAVGASRSALADRFMRFVEQPPMQYLTHWRIQIAARLLTDGTMKVASVAREVGYDSEAAFSRAFKKIAGVSPANWRRAPVA